ncbi:MAG: hypothetical protein R3284_10205 [Rubricoccaceae bacterium]|nr:hypothetical protein [Rubricoccaceae bacterium]
MTDKKKQTGRKVDLSTGKSSRKKKTLDGVAPIIQETINLSTSKQAPTEAQEQSSPKTDRKRSDKPQKRKKQLSSGNSLADLLDPETLAKLRGNG